MAKQTQREGWQLTLPQRAALQEGLSVLVQAREMFLAIRARKTPFFEGWAQSREEWADAIQQSFEYFLSSPSIHPAYVFAGWIDEPAFLMKEINAFVQMFDLDMQQAQVITQGQATPCEMVGHEMKML